MNEAQKAILLTEVQTDPLSLGYAKYIVDCPGVVANMLNEPRHATVGKIPIDDFISILYDTGVFDAMFDAAEDGNAMLAREIKRLQVLKGFGLLNMDFSNPSASQRLTASGVPAEVIAILVNKATYKKSRASLIGLDTVSALDVQEAVNGNN